MGKLSFRVACLFSLVASAVAAPEETPFEDFKQSPTGVWYPTTVKTTGTIWVKQVKPLIVEPRDQDWRLSIEFKKSLPDELFDIKAAMKR